ncbi:MAG: hypothetical protein RIF46_12195 [Cyclobacteriaceae bacterium]
MTGIFRYYTNPENDIYFPGAPFVMGTILALLSIAIVRISLSRLKS